METFGMDVASSSVWDQAHEDHGSYIPGYSTKPEDPGSYYLAGDFGVQQQTLDYGYSSDGASYSYSEYQDCDGGQLSPSTTSSSSPVPATYNTFAFEQQQVDLMNSALDLNTEISVPPSAILNLPPKKLPGKKQKQLKAVSAAVRAKRRQDANARERKRMTGLNGAFSRLRAVLGCTRDRPLSKMEALQTAQQRIAELREMLEVVGNGVAE